VEFRILGPLEVVAEGESVELGALKERLVLGVLLLHANEFVSRERLIDDLWGEKPPPTARKAVNVYVSKLRKALSARGADPITTAAGGYRLNVETEMLDASRMQALVAEARRRIGEGELESAAQDLQEALSLWRGPTLAGLQLESLGRNEVAQLDELRLTALMDRLDCDLALGRHEQAVGELGVLVREHPLRERLRAQQMLALYRADRQVEALEAYAQARQTLVDDLGIEPSEALQRLQQAILRHDPSLGTPEGTAAVRRLAATESVSPSPVTDQEGGELPARTRYRPRRWQLALAAIVILGGSTAAAAVLSSPAGAHVVPDSLVRLNPSSGAIVSVTRMGAAPEAIAVTPRAIWTSNFSDTSVSRYDLRTHRVLTLGAPPAPFNIVADSAENVWVSSLVHSEKISHYGFGARRISAGSLRPEHSSVIRVPDPGAEALALEPGYLWAIAGPKTTFGKDDLVSLVNPASNKVVQHWHIGHETTAIAVGDGAAWVAGYGSESFVGPNVARWGGASTLTVIQPTTRSPRSYRLERGDVGGPTAVAYGGRNVWVLTCGGCVNQKLLEFDPQKEKVIGRFLVGNRNPDALAVGAGSVWLTDQIDASVAQINPKTLRILRTIPIGKPGAEDICGIAATHDAVWVAVGDAPCEDTGAGGK
jgi:DNA-binding SARP family transcriptional activator/streptogramin lyase